MSTNRTKGFSLVELMIALAIIGVIAAVAIPVLSGQRTRARRIGDAEANARILAMGLEALKAENGIYGPANATATWLPTAAAPTLTGFTTNPVPNFKAQGSSKMAYVVTVVTPLTYTIAVHEGTTSGTKWIQVDQTGAKTIYQK